MQRKPTESKCRSVGRAVCREVKNALSLSTVILQGKSSATVYGCRKILFYSQKKIILKTSGDTVAFTGNDLHFSSFCAGTVCLCGTIAQVCFAQGSESEERSISEDAE